MQEKALERLMRLMDEREARSEERHRALLEEHKRSHERWEEQDKRAEARHRELLEEHKRLRERWEEQDMRAEARHAQLMRRSERSERIFVEALSDIDASLQRSIERLDDMADAIRANTRAVLSVLDRLGPGTASA